MVRCGWNLLLHRQSPAPGQLLVEQIEALRAAYADAARRQPFETVAVCVPPNHLHCIWTLPAGDSDFPGRWRRIRAGFSRPLPRSADLAPGRRPGERGVRRRRFWEHVVTDVDDLAAHIDYIHANPVKPRLVADVDFHRGIGGRGRTEPARWREWCISAIPQCTLLATFRPRGKRNTVSPPITASPRTDLARPRSSCRRARRGCACRWL